MKFSFLLVLFSYLVNVQILPSFQGVYDKKTNATGTVIISW
jgi:hypothetical protein|tara:strand:- start:50 stop:172 length:123 start_codon:yes stop_codon:yes gene_type:complete